MAVGAIRTEGDLERFFDDRYGHIEILLRQLQGGGYVGSLTGDAATTQFTLEHGLGSYDVHVTVYADASPRADAAVTRDRPSEDEVRITFGVAPALGVVYSVLVSRVS